MSSRRVTDYNVGGEAGESLEPDQYSHSTQRVTQGGAILATIHRQKHPKLC